MKIVEFFGIPGSGKSTAVKSLHQLLGCNRVNHKKYKEAFYSAIITDLGYKYDFPFNKLLHYLLKNIYRIRNINSKYYENFYQENNLFCNQIIHYVNAQEITNYEK